MSESTSQAAQSRLESRRHASYDPAMTATNRYPSLHGRNVFVTGGASGIGAAIVTGFAAQGARVAFVDVAEAAAAALAEAVAAAGHPTPWWQRCDVRDVAALQAAMASAAAALGAFHVLVNNVASDDRHTLESVEPAYYDEPVINLGSTGWQTKSADYPVYAVAKSAVNGLTRGTAMRLGRHGIRINTVSPGWVMTERQKQLWLTPEGEAEIDRHQCLPDRLQPQDVAAMVLFLASDDARMCTAQEFIVDGGWT